MIWIYLYGVAALLLFGPGLDGLLRRLVRIYGCYFVIAFVLRATLLVIYNPVPRKGSSFAISALAYRGYGISLEALLPFVCTASLALFLMVFIGQRFLFRRCNVASFSVSPSVAASVYFLGLLLRLLGFFASDSSVLTRFSSLGQGVSAGILAALIVGSDWRNRAPKLTLALAAVECLTSLPLASKTPLLTVLLLLYLDPRRPALRVRMILLSSLAIVVAFTGLQTLKPHANALQGENWIEQTFFSLTGRLDGLYAMSGAWVSGPGSYVPEGGLLGAVFSGLTPGWLQSGDKLLAGRLWGIHVYHVNTGVSYAEGLAAEGYVMGGMLGPAFWGLTGGFIFLAVIWALNSKTRYIQLVAFSFMASTVMFERGMLGQLEQLGSVIQSGLIALVGLVLFEGIMGPRRRNRQFVSFAKAGARVDKTLA